LQTVQYGCQLALLDASHIRVRPVYASDGG
jgi:hypothetical protein